MGASWAGSNDRVGSGAGAGTARAVCAGCDGFSAAGAGSGGGFAAAFAPLPAGFCAGLAAVALFCFERVPRPAIAGEHKPERATIVRATGSRS